MKQELAGRPQVVVAKAVAAEAAAKAVVARVEARIPPRELPKMMDKAVLVVPVVLVVQVVVSVEEVALVEDSRVSMVEMMMMVMMTPTSVERQGVMGNHQDDPWHARSHISKAQFTLQSTGTCQFSTSPVIRREQNWASEYWSGQMHKNKRSTKQGCRVGK